jgi:cytoskeleton protein RodZ
MNDNAYQETLFAEPLGLQLKHAREKLGLKVNDAAARLKLPADVIEALELENWGKLGAAIYVRSYLGSYIKLLGLPGSLINEFNIKTSEMPAMKILSEKPVRRDVDKTLSTLGYFAITGVIVTSIVMIAMHFQSPKNRSETLPLDIQSQTLVEPLPSAPIKDPIATENTTGTAQTPMMASMAPQTAAASASGWEVRASADSWMEVIGIDGKRIESGIAAAGAVKQYAAGQVSSMKIGNADKVQLLRNGQVVDFSAFKQDNVARFKIASDGTLIANPASSN